MANLFKGLKPKAHLSSNGFDLSQKHVFSTAPGMLVPVASWETVPNDYFEINMVSLMRSMTMNTAAFVRGKQHFDFYFVPYSQLWHPFNQFITQREDSHSVNQKGFLYVPTVNLEDVLQLIFADYQTHVQAGDDVFGYNFCINAVRLLDMLGYGNYQWVLNLASDNTKTSEDLGDIITDYGLDDKRINIFRLAAYQHIWYDIYRNKFYDVMDRSSQDQDYVSCFNFDDMPCNTFGNSCIESYLSANNFKQRMYGLFRMRYVGWKKDLFTSLMPSQQFGAVSSVTAFGNGLVSIQGSATLSGTTGNSLDKYKFRGDYSISDDETVKFHSSSGSPILGNLMANDSNSTPHVILHDHSISGTASLSTQASASNVQSVFDVLSLYKAEMLQNWKQKTLRAGNMVDDNFEAHFGTSPYYNSDENVNFLGSFEAVLNIDPVETTAQSTGTGNTKVGDLAAKAQAVANGNTIKFSCRDYGVIMCVCSFTPETDYKSLGIDKNNTLYEQFDFFTPEFENIGLEAIGAKSLSHLIADDSVLGYAPRYWNYKGAVDKIHNGFYDFTYKKHGALQPTRIYGEKSIWCAPKDGFYLQDQSGHLYYSLASFYVDPSVYDYVFGVEFNIDHNYKSQEDPFLNNVYFDVKAIRLMSKLGLPEF